MEVSPLVSIIIPVYNGSNYLAEAIDSALAQTYKNIEILVINDGSNDKGATEKIAKSYGDKIKYFPKKNGGASSALNLGIEKMQGQYFSWLSHDDIYYPSKIELQLQELQKYPANTVLFSNVNIIDHSSQFVHKLKSKAFEYDYQLLSLICLQQINGCSLLIPKDMLNKVGGFDENLKTTQDYDMWIKLSEIGRFEYQDIDTVGSRRHLGQESLSVHHIANVDEFIAHHIQQINMSQIEQMSDEQVESFILATADNFSRKIKNDQTLEALFVFLESAIKNKKKARSLKSQVKFRWFKGSVLKFFKSLISISLKLKIKKILSHF